MNPRFDRRVFGEEAIDLVRRCQARVACRLAGGTALAGAYLHHRLSRDVDLFVGSREDLALLKRELPDCTDASGATLAIRQDSGSFLRYSLAFPSGAEGLLDLAVEPQLAEPVKIEGILTEPIEILAASKVACLLSRCEPRDLVDIYFLEKAAHPPEECLAMAAKLDAGLDPALLAWLLRDIPVEPLPVMLKPITKEDLLAYRDALGKRFRRMALPSSEKG